MKEEIEILNIDVDLEEYNNANNNEINFGCSK